MPAQPCVAALTARCGSLSSSYEFATTVRHYYGKRWYIAFQVRQEEKGRRRIGTVLKRRRDLTHAHFFLSRTPQRFSTTSACRRQTSPQ